MPRNVTVNVAPSTAAAFNDAANNNNFQVDGGSILDTTNALSIYAPSSGANYVGVSLGGSSFITGVGGLKTSGNVSTGSGTATFTAPFEVVAGNATGNGTFNGTFKVDSSASFKLLGFYVANGDLAIESNAMLDINGQQMNFQGDHKTFTNNGTLTNSAATFNSFNFIGSFTPGEIVQTFSGAGNYGSNLRVRLYAAVWVLTSPSTNLSGLRDL